MKRIRRSHAVVADPNRHFLLSVIKNAQDVITGEIAGVTDAERDEAIDFLQGEKCALWCDLLDMDHGRLVERFWERRGREGIR